MILVAIDPALRTSGVAIFDNGILVSAYYVVNPAKGARDAHAWAQGGQAIYNSLRPWIIDELVIEVMQAYPGGRGGNPNDLLQVSGVAGAVASLLGNIPKYSVLPRIWKKQLPKNVCHERLRKVLSKEEILAITPGTQKLQENTWDAIGIGLWRLGRWRA